MDDPTRYKDLGLVNTREMFKKAMADGYAVPAYNFNNMEQLQAIVIGCVESKSPVILQVSGSARKYADPIPAAPHGQRGGRHGQKNGQFRFPLPCTWTMAIVSSWPKTASTAGFLRSCWMVRTTASMRMSGSPKRWLTTPMQEM